MSASLIDNQLYELRPLCDLTKNMAVGSSSKTDGAKVIVYEELYYCNDQKWIVAENTGEGGGWRLRNLESLKYAVVWWPTSASPFVEGSDIVQWTGGDQNMWLTPIQTDTVEVGGVECPVIVFKLRDHDDYALSVSDAYYYGSLQVKLAEADATSDTQQWVCIPTVARSYDIPKPYDLEVSGDTVKSASNSVSFSVYPMWKVTADVASRSGITYIFRSRTRTMDVNGVWGEWSDWAGWMSLAETAGYTRSEQQVTAVSAISAAIGSAEKMAQAMFQVRTCTPASGSGNVFDRPWASPAVEYTADLLLKPTVTIGDSTWSPDGLSIAATSSYSDRGATTILIESIKVSDAELLKEPISATLIGASGTYADIPQDMLLGIPASGSTLSATYSVGTDTGGMFDGSLSGTSSLSYASGTVTPTVTDNAGMTKKVSVAGSDDAKVWMLFDGKLYECPDGVVAYPFGEEYTLFASGTVNGTKFAWSQGYTGSSTGAHAWNWDGGYASLEAREGEPLTMDDSIDAESESYDLSGRAWETVDFSGTRHQKITARGAVLEGVTSSARDDFELISGIHATYRSPRGDMFPVAVMSVSREAHKRWTSIDVTMVREG